MRLAPEGGARAACPFPRPKAGRGVCSLNAATPCPATIPPSAGVAGTLIRAGQDACEATARAKRARTNPVGSRLGDGLGDQMIHHGRQRVRT
jgi:hypothetical protein